MLGQIDTREKLNFDDVSVIFARTKVINHVTFGVREARAWHSLLSFEARRQRGQVRPCGTHTRLYSLQDKAFGAVD